MGETAIAVLVVIGLVAALVAMTWGGIVVARRYLNWMLANNSEVSSRSVTVTGARAGRAGAPREGRRPSHLTVTDEKGVEAEFDLPKEAPVPALGTRGVLRYRAGRWLDFTAD